MHLSKIKAVGERTAILSGDDDLGFPTFLLGSPGGIFMSANLIPAFQRRLFEASVAGQIEIARTVDFALLPLIEALYTANHAGPLKDALTLIGHPVGTARAPLHLRRPWSVPGSPCSNGPRLRWNSPLGALRSLVLHH